MSLKPRAGDIIHARLRVSHVTYRGDMIVLPYLATSDVEIRIRPCDLISIEGRPIAVGDDVTISGGDRRWEVLAINDGRAWLRDGNTFQTAHLDHIRRA